MINAAPLPLVAGSPRVSLVSLSWIYVAAFHLLSLHAQEETGLLLRKHWCGVLAVQV